MAYLLTGGTVVDGTGSPGYRASVLLGDGGIRIIRGTERITDVDVIDVTGLVVAPGFIDMHSHTGLTLLDDPQHAPKLTQGVTTEVIGVDGFSYAPFADRDNLLSLVRMNAGLDGLPDLDYEWSSVDSYLSRFDRGVGVNVAMMVGNATLRAEVVGWDERAADTNEIVRMRRILREAMAQGAFGLSSGLDYPPGSYASTAELVSLCEEVAELGGMYHTHVRYWLGDRHLDPFREAIEIARDSDCRLHMTHLYTPGHVLDGVKPLIDLLDDTHGQGIDVSFDLYPYEWTGTRAIGYLPQWMQSGGPEATIRRLADPQSRRRFKAELAEDSDDMWRTQLDYVAVGYLDGGENARFESWTLGEIARYRDVDVVDALFDLLIEEDLKVAEVLAPGPLIGNRMQAFITHRLGMIGTDSMYLGDRPSPRSFGSFPRILGEFCREDDMFTLPDAIRRFTSLPAQRLGLRRRGQICDGFVADVTVFDPQRVRARATHAHPRRESEGICHVFIDGQRVLSDGVPTGVLAGRALRFGTD
ncbi:N-acyl-D-amino-acid deacylase family protein [Sphaerimonospora sp. CA-214678]|uniref:N-acyl-D-amino-acid deacylase family protein n=1 Tax=Sphaerimonospora sp. CA-214678 TaxID=3240029 RepID=UPI003D9376F7